MPKKFTPAQQLQFAQQVGQTPQFAQQAGQTPQQPGQRMKGGGMGDTNVYTGTVTQNSHYYNAGPSPIQ